eukprot:9362223-Pyramimonas_sp.AAC.1
MAAGPGDPQMPRLECARDPARGIQREVGVPLGATTGHQGHFRSAGAHGRAPASHVCGGHGWSRVACSFGGYPLERPRSPSHWCRKSCCAQ